MKIKKIRQPPKLSKGFSLVELTFSLVIFGAIVLITTKIIEEVNTKKNIYAEKERITAYENIVIKKISANYDNLYKQASTSQNQQLVLDYNYFSDYAKSGAKDIVSNNYFFNPCVLIKADTERNTLSATLIYPVNKNLVKNSLMLSNELGNASWKKDSELIGKLRRDYYVNENIGALTSACGVSSFSNGSIFIDLNNNNSLTSKKSNITDNSTNNGTNETLKNNSDNNSSNKSIGTNLYMDAIVKESTPYSTNYCDGSRAETQYSAKVHDTCVAYATNNKTYLDGVEKITNGALVNDKCEYTATANFSGYFSTMWVGGNTIPELVASGQPYINAGCKYGSTQGTTSQPSQICVLSFAGSEALYPNRGCRYGNTYSCTTGGTQKEFTICAEDTNNQKYLNEGCVKTAGPWENGTNHTGACTTQELAYGASYQYVDSVLCKVGGSTSNPNACGKFTVEPYINSGITPPQHKYKSLSFGDKGRGNILVKSGTADGTTSESDVFLNVANAGVKSGFVIIKSKYTQPDKECKSSEIGKILQQYDETGNYTTSQLICSYDTDFCGGTGYCYAPLISQTQFVINGSSANPTPINLLTCPAGLRADTSWLPSIANAGMINPGNCNGTIIAVQINDASKVIGYKSVCKLTNGTENNINALTKIKCTSASTLKTTTCERDENDQLQCK